LLAPDEALMRFEQMDSRKAKVIELRFFGGLSVEIGAEMLFEVFSQRYERTSTLVSSNLPFAEWTEVLGSERLPAPCWIG
jgi:IstB-like ATP binding protein/ECF sigma factor